MSVKRRVQSHGPVVISAVWDVEEGGCVEAPPEVMSCLAAGLSGNPALLGAALSIG